MKDLLSKRIFGTPEGTRTHGLLLRRQLLYPTELLAHMAERVGFEPTDGLPSLIFRTSSFGRSDTSPDMAAADGIEPPPSESESDILPIYDAAIWRSERDLNPQSGFLDRITA